MAQKLSPEKLREQAQALLEQAKQVEADRQTMIGKLVSGYIENDFEGFDLESFKDQVKEIWAEGKLKKKKSKSPKLAAVSSQ